MTKKRDATTPVDKEIDCRYKKSPWPRYFAGAFFVSTLALQNLIRCCFRGDAFRCEAARGRLVLVDKHEAGQHD